MTTHAAVALAVAVLVTGATPAVAHHGVWHLPPAGGVDPSAGTAWVALVPLVVLVVIGLWRAARRGRKD